MRDILPWVYLEAGSKAMKRSHGYNESADCAACYAGSPPGVPSHPRGIILRARPRPHECPGRPGGWMGTKTAQSASPQECRRPDHLRGIVPVALTRCSLECIWVIPCSDLSLPDRAPSSVGSAKRVCVPIKRRRSRSRGRVYPGPGFGAAFAPSREGPGDPFRTSASGVSRWSANWLPQKDLRSVNPGRSRLRDATVSGTMIVSRNQAARRCPRDG